MKHPYVRLGLLVLAAVIAVAWLFTTVDRPLPEVWEGFVRGTTGTPIAWTGTLRETTPLLLLGAGVFIALRAGLFNIGIEGQFIVGAACSAWVALNLPGPLGSEPVRMLLAMLAGGVAGALWALPAAWIKAYRNGHEVISTIMLNSIAIALTDFLVAGPLKDPKGASPSTAKLAEAMRLPFAFSQGNLQVSSGLLLGIALAVAMYLWLRFRVAGYELRLTGENPTAARAAGVSVARVTMAAMVASGAIGGAAGAIHVLAFEGRFYQGFSPGYGFDALGVALLAAGNSLLLIPAGFLFGFLTKGGASLQVFGVPKGITTIMLGLIILVAAAIRYRRESNDA